MPLQKKKCDHIGKGNASTHKTEKKKKKNGRGTSKTCMGEKKRRTSFEETRYLARAVKPFKRKRGGGPAPGRSAPKKGAGSFQERGEREKKNTGREYGRRPKPPHHVWKWRSK